MVTGRIEALLVKCIHHLFTVPTSPLPIATERAATASELTVLENRTQRYGRLTLDGTGYRSKLGLPLLSNTNQRRSIIEDRVTRVGSKGSRGSERYYLRLFFFPVSEFVVVRN